jgi:dolichol-phosphate mannosyltransferase
MTPPNAPDPDGRTADAAVRVSVVVPLHNEADNVPGLVTELQALHDHVPGLELVLVDDGSTDGTWAAIQQAARQVPGVRGLHDPVNRGQSSALLTGLRAARGVIMVTLDGDLQNDPADIPAMLQRLEGCDAVCGWRTHRQDSWSRRVAPAWRMRCGSASRRRDARHRMQSEGLPTRTCERLRSWTACTALCRLFRAAWTTPA